MVISSSQTDFTTSVRKALEEIDPEYQSYRGLIVTGSHKPKEIDKKLRQIERARTNGTPFLGICMGMQLMVIEYARNVLGLVEANSTEIEEDCSAPVVYKLPELRVGIHPVRWAGKSTQESHWHNYAVNPTFQYYYYTDFYMSETDEVIEVMKMKNHSHFMGVQFHPEYQSSKDNPHDILLNFVDVCRRITAA